MTLSRNIWRISLLSFIIAILTGFLFRAGMFYPVGENLSLANIRHAHSHLMFFNWISPPIMGYMMNRLLSNRSDLSDADILSEIKASHICLYTMLFLGFLSYPFFLYYGYQSVQLGSSMLPLAAIISGMVMITWYWFAVIYIRNRTRVKPDLPILFFDAALLALLISSAGAWGVSIFQFTDADSALISSALTHFFLALFTEGWALLGALGILWSHSSSIKTSGYNNWLWVPILFGALLVFPFSLTQSMLSPLMVWTAKAGTAFIALSLLLNLAIFYKSGLFKNFLCMNIGLFLLFKILFQFAAVLPLDIWPGEHGPRVLYLHLSLLGLISSSILFAFNQKMSLLAENMFVITVWPVMISLMMISGYWPPSLLPGQLYYWVMLISLLPIIPAIWILVRDFNGSTHLNQSKK